MKGDRKDPTNYRGILLDIAGKILASVIDARLKKLIERNVSDTQCGFRPRRSPSHLIHILRRAQEACRVSNLKAYAVFIDFKKAFDSPPREALWECLEWAGCPVDLLMMIQAIHQDPTGNIIGTNAAFRVSRGVRQGCVLGPTLFIKLLEFCLRLAKLEGIGIEFICIGSKHLTCPPDLLGRKFRLSRGEFADDVFLVGLCPAALSSALSKIQKITGDIGLDISVAKTEWIYLHYPNEKRLLKCQKLRKESPADACCEEILLDGERLGHASSFCYLGSMISEGGGMVLETRKRICAARASLNR
jgi:hypothetical protein